MSKAPCCPFCDLELPDPADAATPRSYDQLKRFFAMVRAAHFHWPEMHPVQFETAEKCRHWLLVRVGHGKVKGTLPVVDMPPEAARALARQIIRCTDDKCVVTIRGGELLIVEPLSIAFAADDAGHKAFCVISDKVQGQIENICGASIEELLSTTPAPSRRIRSANGEGHDRGSSKVRQARAGYAQGGIS